LIRFEQEKHLNQMAVTTLL